jgi:GT2 family glycosyltransferase
MSQNSKQMADDPASPLVGVLVLNYNGLRFLRDCYDSLRKSRYPHFIIYLVDNNSTDQSVEFTQTQYPDVRIIQTGKNSGYSRAYNIAMSQADGKYFVLLNNDVVVDPGWLDHLVPITEKNPEVAALQPKILSMLKPDNFEYAGASGGYIDRYGYPFLRGRIFYSIEPDEHQYDDAADVFWTSGAAMFVRADVLKHAGNLDEDFVHHMEEIDWCWRLHLAGFKLMVIPASVIYHYAGATIKEGSYRKLYWNHRNNIFMLVKNLDTGNLLKILPQRIALDMINVMYSSFIKFDFRHAYAILAAYTWLVSHVPLLWRKRKQVQSRRFCRDKSMEHLVYHRSLVLDYFVWGKSKFSDLKFQVEKRENS